MNGLYAELIRRRGSWRAIEQVELPNFELVQWWNNQRFHSELDYRAPVEVEQVFYASLEEAPPAAVREGDH